MGEWFPLVVVGSSGYREIMRATARTGDLNTVTGALTDASSSPSQ
jgi:hypothetical protein